MNTMAPSACKEFPEDVTLYAQVLRFMLVQFLDVLDQYNKEFPKDVTLYDQDPVLRFMLVQFLDVL